MNGIRGEAQRNMTVGSHKHSNIDKSPIITINLLQYYVCIYQCTCIVPPHVQSTLKFLSLNLIIITDTDLLSVIGNVGVTAERASRKKGGSSVPDSGFGTFTSTSGRSIVTGDTFPRPSRFEVNKQNYIVYRCTL